MKTIRRAGERGHADHGWLDTYHTFSFADYHDPAHERFRSLRVINEDRVAPSTGFGAHPHRDMEIITYVLSGQLQHRDSMGNGAVVHPGELQRITAGSGMLHSEFNPSGSEPVHLYQIWIFPHTRGLDPSWEQKRFDPAARRNRLQVVASPSGEDGSLVIQQDARVYLADLDAGREFRHELAPGRHAWVQVVRGTAEVDGQRLAVSDGLAVSDEPALVVRAAEDTEVMLFDLP